MLKIFQSFSEHMGRKSFFSHAVTLMAGTAVAQVITLLGTFVLARFYGPAHFGVYSMFAGMTALIGVWVALRYEVAIALPKRQEDAMALVRFSLLITGSISGLLFVVILLGDHYMLRLVKIRELLPWMALLPFSVFLTGSYNIVYYWCLRNRYFSSIAIARVVKSVLTLAGPLAAYPFVHMAGGGLILGYVLGLVGGASALLGKCRFIYANRIRLPQMLNMASRYADFPKLSGVGSFLDTASSQIPLIVIPILFSPHVGGAYAVTDRLFRGATDFFSLSLGQVLYQRFVGLKNDREETRSLLFRTWKWLLLASIGPVLLVVLFGRDIFTFLLGPGWSDAGMYAEILCIGFVPQFIFSPTSLGFVALERLDTLLGWQALYFASMVAVLLLGYLFLRQDLTSFLWLWSVKEVALYLLYGVMILKTHRKYESSLTNS